MAFLLSANIRSRCQVLSPTSALRGLQQSALSDNAIKSTCNRRISDCTMLLCTHVPILLMYLPLTIPTESNRLCLGRTVITKYELNLRLRLQLCGFI